MRRGTLAAATILTAALALSSPYARADDDRDREEESELEDEDHDEQEAEDEAEDESDDDSSDDDNSDDDSSGDDSGSGDACSTSKRAEHDLRVRLKVRGKKRARLRVRVNVRNQGRNDESGVTVRLVSDETGEVLWTTTLDLPRGKRRRFSLKLDRPADTSRIVASASMADGVSDCDPDDDTDDDSIDPGGSAGDAARGAALYVPLCSACHGADGRGGTADENIARESWQETYEVFREGDDGMPAFRDLSARDAKGIVAYLRNPTAPAPVPDPDPSPDPDPAPDPGPTPPPTAAPTYTGAVKAILDRACTACHRSGSAAAGIRLDTYATASASPAGWLGSIRAGRMPPGGSFPTADINTIQAWIDGGATQ